jgi:hypothetical protein
LISRRQLPALFAAAALQVMPWGTPEPTPGTVEERLTRIEERQDGTETEVAVASLVLMKHEGYLDTILECWGGCGLFPEFRGEV